MKKSNIRRYIAWLTLMPLLVIVVGLESFFLHHNFSDSDHNLIERGQLIARQFASSSEYGVFANNQSFMQNIAHGVLQQPDVQAVIILDATSGVLLEAGDFFDAPKNALNGAYKATPDTAQQRAARVGQIKELVGLQKPIHRSSEGLWIYQPIVPAQVELDDRNAGYEVLQTGAVIVGLSSANTERRNSQMLWSTVGLTAIFLVVSLYLIALGSRKITVPIRKLSNAIQALGDGRLETRVSVSVPVTELETLAHGINDMAAKLQQEQVALNQRSTSLAQAQRIAHLGSWEWDIASNSLQWSAEMYRIFGLSPQEFVPTYEAFLQTVQPQDRQSVDAKVLDALERRSNYDIDFRILLPDGSLRYVHAQGEAHFTQDGQPLEMVGTIQDITERKLAEENILKLSQAVAQSPNSIVITDLEATIEYVNEGFIKITGYSRAEAIGQNPRILQSGKTPKEIYKDMWAQLKRGEVWKGELANRRKDGSEYVESVLISPVRQADGSVTHYLAIKEDITQHKQTQDALRASREQLHRLLNSIAEGAYGVDTDGNCTFVNRAFMKMLGYQNDVEVMGKHMHELIHYSHADGRPYPANECKAYSASRLNQSINVSDEVFWRKDGVAIPVEYWSHPIVSDGVVIGSIVTFIDITERKRLELDREQYLKFFMLSNNPMCMADPYGCFTQVNPAFVKLTGYSENELIAKPFLDFILPEDRQRTGDEMKLQVESRPTMQFDNRYLCKNGSVIDLSWTAYYDKHDGVTYATAIDITERKRMEEALRTSEAEFRTLAEAMPQIVWITRSDGWNTYFNQKWMDYTGLTIEESLGHGWNKPFHPDDRQRAWDAWQQATKTNGIYSIESRLRRADGIYRWWLVRGVPLQDAEGNILKWFGTCTDINDIKMAELEISRINLELRESERRFRDLLENVELVSVMRDREERITYCNEFLLRLTGWKYEEIIGANWVKRFVPPEIAKQERGVFAELLLNKPDTRHYESEILARSGERRLIRWNHSLLRSANGDVIGTASIGEDITERTQIETKLAEQLAELRRWHDVTTGREGRILELKHEVNELLEQSGKQLRYPSAESQDETEK